MSLQPSLTSGVALALALAMGLSPACAAGKHKKHHAAHHRMGMPMQAAQVAQYGAPSWGGGASGTGPLYFAQEYLGTDPDPGIRFQLMRDITGRYGGGGD
jgi:hypothetical protein